MTLPRLLQGALDADPARALITFYDDSSGERTELSVATFANWVAKTANLMQDELGMTAGQRVAIRLPLHWQAAVWLAARWAPGAVAAPGSAAADAAVVWS
ncbi:MAG: TIGR03089 family protein, partial [Actinomycetes bacterium]